MSLPPPEPADQAQAQALLNQYSFDLDGNSAHQIINRWSQVYDISWLPLAVIEALYLGRYKAISVQQILELWKRRNQPIYHFNSEFQRLVSHNLPPNLTQEKTSQDIIPNHDPQESNKSDRPSSLSLKYSDFCVKLQSIVNNSQPRE